MSSALRSRAELRASTATLVLLLAGCRFGGPGGDALALVEPLRDAGVDAGMGVPPADGDDEPGPSEPQDAAQPLPLEDASLTDASATGDAAMCQSTTLLVCDPVHDTGCTPGLTQCVVDLEASTPAGRCVFSDLTVSPCTESALSTSCPPQHSCAAGVCRKYCFCDSDCAGGERCGDPVDGIVVSGVRLCRGPDG